MRRLAVEAELGGLVGQGGARAGAVVVSRVPMEGNINVVEESRPDHVYLPGATLLGWSAVEPDGALDPCGLQPFLGCDGGSGASGPE